MAINNVSIQYNDGLRQENGARGVGRGEATAREPVLVTPLWGMLYADDAGVVP